MERKNYKVRPLFNVSNVTVYENRVSYESEDEKEYIVIPMSSVSSVGVVYKSKPIWLVLSILFFLAGIVITFGFKRDLRDDAYIPLVVGIVLGILFLIGYFLSRTLTFEVSSNGGENISITFRAGTMKTLDLKNSADVIAFLAESLVKRSYQKTKKEYEDFSEVEEYEEDYVEDNY